METQLKEELKEDSLCFETSSENLASLSVIEKYDRFLQKGSPDVDDSDADDFFPDDTMLRREYAQLRSDTENYKKITNHRLSAALPVKYLNNLDSTTVSVTDDDTPNGSLEESGKEAGDSVKTETGLIELGKLLQKLEEVRKCDHEEGNSIFCTAEELHAIQERYGEILDHIHNLTPFFEKANISRDSDSQQLDGDASSEENNGTSDPSQSQSEGKQLLANKMESVAKARDRFFEVEQQVREQIEQLELVERYKMESVS